VAVIHARQVSRVTKSESEGEKKKNVEKQYSVTQQTQQARNVQPTAAISRSYLHNGFPNVLKRLLHKFTDAMDLPSGDDKVLGLIRLQHQPHGLRKDKVRFSPRGSGLFHLSYYCISELEITTHTHPKLGKSALSEYGGY